MLISFLRTGILYIFVIAAVRLMGKRQVGELSPSELVVTILISELAAIPMQNLTIPLVQGIIPILTLVLFEILFSILNLKSETFRKIMTGKSSMVIKEGEIQQEELKKQRVSIDDLNEELRLQGVTSPDQVQHAMLETTGKLSVFLKNQYSPITKANQNSQSESKVSVPVIVDGKLQKQNLHLVPITQGDIINELNKQNLKVKDIYFMYCGDTIQIIRKEGKACGTL